jgi:hypothetical protein
MYVSKQPIGEEQRQPVIHAHIGVYMKQHLL